MSLIDKLERKRVKGEDGANLRNGLWSGIEYLVLVGTLLITLPLIMNRRGEEEFGIFVLAQTLSGANGIFSLGLAQATLKAVSEMREHHAPIAVIRVVNATLWVTLGFGVVVVGGIMAGAGWMAQDLFSMPEGLQDMGTDCLKLAGMGLFGFLTIEVAASVCHGFERYDLTAPVRSAQSLLILVAQVILLLNGGSVRSLLLAQVVCMFLAAAALFFLMRKCLLPGYAPWIHPQRADARRVFGFGFFSWLSTLFAALRTRGDVFLIGVILGSTAAGYYSVAQRLLGQAHAFLVRGFNFLFPYVSRYHARGDVEMLESTYSKYTFLIGGAGILVVTPLSTLADPLLRTWMNPEMAEVAGPLMQIMALRFAVFPLSIVNSYFLLGTGRVKLMTMIVGCNAAMALSCIAWGANTHGLTGAAWGQLSIMPGLLVNRWIMERVLFGRVRLLRVVMPVLLAAVSVLVAMVLAPVVGGGLWVSALGLGCLGIGIALPVCAVLYWTLPGRKLFFKREVRA